MYLPLFWPPQVMVSYLGRPAKGARLVLQEPLSTSSENSKRGSGHPRGFETKVPDARAEPEPRDRLPEDSPSRSLLVGSHNNLSGPAYRVARSSTLTPQAG